MQKTVNREYSMDSRIFYADYDSYCDTTRSFGYFSKDGKSYTITDQDTPRQWMNILLNDKFISVIANHGEGYTAFGGNHNRITKDIKTEFYIIRELVGKRVLEIIDTDTGKVIDLFSSNNIKCTVTPAFSEFTGETEDILFSVKVFVPRDAYCECWLVELNNKGKEKRNFRIHACQTWAFNNTLKVYGSKIPCENLAVKNIDNGFFATADNMNLPFNTMYGAFTIENMATCYKENVNEKVAITTNKNPNIYKNHKYTYVHLYSDVTLEAEKSASLTVVSSSSNIAEEVTTATQKYTCVTNAKTAFEETVKYYEKEFSYNTCSIPDKNLERFLNTWFKQQLGITYRLNRNTQNAGFRDLLQDIWGAMLIHPNYPVERMDEILSHLYSDGHSMRGYDSYAGITNPTDFVDCPLWAPNTVLQYLKETGDLSYLNKQLPYFDSEKTETVLEHLHKTVDFVYNHRGNNGLVLMRDGDWLDGLAGINQNGTATSAWATMQAYWAQDCMAQIYDAIGQTANAQLMRSRNSEYKEVVRRVAWDGKWYVYAFKSDGLPVGSHKCQEGKIYLNTQTWAIFTGIEDDPKRIKSMMSAVNTYLTTIYGPMMLYPPYVNDKTCGGIHKLVPGTFSNAAIYLHGSSFKVFSDITIGEYDDAYDTFMRLLPNHPDNSDSRRTSEPYTTGNVHFGPDSERFGMNLFSWFTGTPAWLIHAGFEKMLGAQAEFDGLHIHPCVPSDWNEYSVNRLYRGNEYRLHFRRANSNDIKGIYKDDLFIDSCVIDTDHPGGDYIVLY